MHKYGGKLIHRVVDDQGVIEVVDDSVVRSMHFGDETRQSSQFMAQPAVLVHAYAQAMMASLLFIDMPKTVLMIGLGGGSIAQFLRFHVPGATLHAVEPRPSVIEVAQAYFKLELDEKLQVHVADGETWLANNGGKFPLILVDAFSAGGIEAIFAEKPLLRQLREQLTDHGVLAMNLSRLEKKKHKRALKNFNAVFGEQHLRLPVFEKANEIAFGFASHQRGADGLDSAAAALQKKHGLDYPGLLKTLREENPRFRRVKPA